jgi:hypothetical protein
MYRNPIHFVCYLDIFFFILYYKPVSHLVVTKTKFFYVFAFGVSVMSYDYQPTVLWQVFSATQFTLNPGNQPFISTWLFNPVIQPGDST